MASAIGARHDGDDYQSRLFWLHACDLFDPTTHVVAVAYEEVGTKAFDDVVVYYDDTMRDEDGVGLVADHLQAKFHRRPSGAVTLAGLMDPAFIGAERYSLLQRLRDAHHLHTVAGSRRRFILETPWEIDPHDALAQIVSLADEAVRLTLDAGPRSHAGRVRTQLLEHLGIEDIEELRAILQAFRLRRGPSLPELYRRLNERLRSVGFRPVEAGTRVHPYDDLTRRMVRGRQTRFTRDDIERMCKQELLWQGHTASEVGAVRLGIRSFARGTERLAEETDDHLDLLPHFEGRFPRDAETWHEIVYPTLERFLAGCVSDQRYHLHLRAHASIAFAAGYCLDPKAGIDAVPVQPSTRGCAIWRPALAYDAHVYPPFAVTERPISSAGRDVAIALGATVEVLPDVEAYVVAHLPDVGRIVAFTPRDGAGPDAVLDGTHAQILARQIAAYCRTHRTPDERCGRLHLFPAAPNGLVFFLGQLSRGLGSCVTYEYDFEQNQPGGYRPALVFPPRATRGAA